VSAVALVDHVDDGFSDPVFLLAAPRSFSSVACAMLGQHPELYGLPETHLFVDDTMAGWWERAGRESYQMAHGLVRAVAEIEFGEQTDGSVASATAWLRRRRSETTGIVFEHLSRTLRPLALIDKSPSLAYEVESMLRVRRFFPGARFIHLTRHPRGYCESVLKYMQLLLRPEYRSRERETEPGVAPEWIRKLAHSPFSPDETPVPDNAPLDPQDGWFVLNANVVAFLESLPHRQWTTVRGEDLLARPRAELRKLMVWLGMRADRDAIERMLHPERSPYAHFGPRGARLGNDMLFLERPGLHPVSRRGESLDGPVGWRQDGGGFRPAVAELAGRLGYA
jgi:hypothetical protein